MCRFESAIVVKTDNDVCVYTHQADSSHSKIRELHNLRDAGGLLDRYQTPVELFPTADLLDVSTWTFAFDADKPEWWEDWMEEKVRREMAASIAKKWDG